MPLCAGLEFEDEDSAIGVGLFSGIIFLVVVRHELAVGRNHHEFEFGLADWG